jgi:hypothetical protein
MHVLMQENLNICQMKGNLKWTLRELHKYYVAVFAGKNSCSGSHTLEGYFSFVL